MAKKETLSCKPCGTMVVVSDQGAAVIECYQCGSEMAAKTAKKPGAKKSLKAAPSKKAVAKKPAARKATPKKKK
jgi:DNA-directed RNA polymerase subunit M/transcription elongation factor TFIIS